MFEPVTDTKKTSEDSTKTMMFTSRENNKALENLNNKLLERMNVTGIIASYMLSPLSKITNPENTSQYNLVKGSHSNSVNDLLIHKAIPVTLYDNFLIIRDTGKVFELKRDLLKMITNNQCIVNLAGLSDEKLLYEFAKEMYFDVKLPGNKSPRDCTLIKII